MTAGRNVLVGRRDELAALGATGPGHTIVVLSGERGSGRSVLLAEAADEAHAAGRTVLELDLAREVADWDEYAVGPLLDAVGARFEQLAAGSEVMHRAALLRRRHHPASYRTTDGRAAVLVEMRRLLASIGRSPLLLLDDADRVLHREHLAVVARKVGYRVVVVTGPDAPAGLPADAIVRLGPLTADEVETLARRTLRTRPDPILLATLHRALGPLAGHPTHVLALLEELQAAGRLSTVARRVCLRAPHRMPTLPADAPAMRAVGRPGGIAEDIVLLAGGPVRVRVDDVPSLAVALGRGGGEIGGEIDRLVVEKVLGEVDGALTIVSPAVCATVRARASEERVRQLHAAFARTAVLPDDHRLSEPDVDVLADHVAAAGTALDPDRRWASLLTARAAQDEEHRPGRAARLLLACGRHDPDEPSRSRTTERVLRLLVRAGEHDLLAEVVSDVVTRGDHSGVTPTGVDSALLAATASVAALTLRRPVAEAVHTALAGDETAADPLGIAQGWAAGATPAAADLARALAPLGGPDLGADVDVLVETGDALDARDAVAALQALLGTAYAGRPEGSLALLDTVYRTYRSGDWEDTAAAVRAMFTDHGDDVHAAALRERAVLFVTDTAVLQDDDRAVEAWFDLLPDRAIGSLNRILRAYVHSAQSWVAGDTDAALAVGWRAWGEVPPGAYALIRRALLTRLSGIAATDRRPEWFRRLREAADTWARTAEGPEAIEAAEVRDLVHGVLGHTARDRAARERAVERARDRGHLIDLGWMLMGSAAEDPTTDWAAVESIAQDLQTPTPRARLREFMKQHGVRRPRRRSTSLDDTQSRVLELVAQGMTNRQIARAIRVSEKTVETYVTRLLQQFGCRTRHGLAMARLAAHRDDIAI
ncbi:LuxR C-terminal-related transcriptional regulator [Pseudonocardia sp. ICBG1293]|uniref:LuxR C-terminal-related transcriptional regulator n=1 Tax=Pseudonocardia sp. ICBG1293 TaxID=2844382 RepID=UPI00272E58D1|nr:LuxR C-terminal-related transcriptional regulator [Pseudonocardia sp. ICBG1293]